MVGGENEDLNNNGRDKWWTLREKEAWKKLRHKVDFFTLSYIDPNKIDIQNLDWPK